MASGTCALLLNPKMGVPLIEATSREPVIAFFGISMRRKQRRNYRSDLSRRIRRPTETGPPLKTDRPIPLHRSPASTGS
jgi:hypothetical protein